MYRTIKRLALASLGLTLLSVRPAAAISLFSAGMVTPETISVAPAGFGTFGGAYFVPDGGFLRTGNPATSNIYVVSTMGGAPTLFANNPSSFLLGGLFLPGNWGANAGKFATVGVGAGTAGGTGPIYIYDASGAASLFQAIPGVGLSSVLVAPGGFGGYGGQLLITDQINNGQLFAVAPSGAVTTVASGLGIRAFGMADAPAGFGAAGGQLLVGDLVSGRILNIAAGGTVTPFSNIPLAAGQGGLRQMAFSPAGFIPGHGSLLFVSVSGSFQGGGALGDVVALDGSGAIVASLRTNLGLSKFDPRGLLFTDAGTLLISDASDPILLARPSDFLIAQADVPEPGAGALIAAGLLPLVGLLVRRRA